jgi:hypothetical protein
MLLLIQKDTPIRARRPNKCDCFLERFQDWRTGLKFWVWIVRACFILAFFLAWWVWSLAGPEWVLFRFDRFSIVCSCCWVDNLIVSIRRRIFLNDVCISPVSPWHPGLGQPGCCLLPPDTPRHADYRRDHLSRKFGIIDISTGNTGQSQQSAQSTHHLYISRSIWKPISHKDKMTRLIRTLPHRLLSAQKRPFSSTLFTRDQPNVQIVTPPSVKYNRPIGGIRAGYVL